MTKQLPWLTTPAITPSTKDIGQPSYGVLQLPFFGSLTPNEELEISNYMLQLKEQSMSEAKVDMATILLKLRCDRSWTKDDTCTQIKSFQLIEDLYEFLLGERNRWQPTNYLLKLEGNAGLQIAETYAKEVSGCVAKIANGETYFVFALSSDVPQEYQVIENFSSPHPASDPVTIPKSES